MDPEDLEQLSTDDLQHRAFAVARHRRDWRFFIDLFRHTPAAASDNLDPDVAEIGVAIDDLVAMWREATQGEWGDAEPLARAAFIDYLSRPEDEPDGSKWA